MSERSVFTRAVHAGERTGGPNVRPTVGAVYLSNTFLHESPATMDAILGGEKDGYTYSRHHNPTVTAMARAVADLEGGGEAIAYASGMAAIHAALMAVPLAAGDTVLAASDLYGASTSLIEEVFEPLGVRAVFADLVDLDGAGQLIARHRPRAILVETISNPLLRLVDGPALARLAHAHGAVLIVDNTFATPLLQRPLDWGADLVVHSATKYLSGHGDVTAGVVVTRDTGRARRLERQIRLTGGILGPFEAWLVHRGVKTLPLRFGRQCDSALHVARRAARSGAFERVAHPLLPDHPDHGRALALYPDGRCGAVVTLDVGGGKARVFRFLAALELVLSATTVGDVYSLALYPAIASHRNLGPEGRSRVGIREGTVRIAVGLEDPDEIADDLIRAARTGRGEARASDLTLAEAPEIG